MCRHYIFYFPPKKSMAGIPFNMTNTSVFFIWAINMPDHLDDSTFKAFDRIIPMFGDFQKSVRIRSFWSRYPISPEWVSLNSYLPWNHNVLYLKNRQHKHGFAINTVGRPHGSWIFCEAIKPSPSTRQSSFSCFMSVVITTQGLCNL